MASAGAASPESGGSRRRRGLNRRLRRLLMAAGVVLVIGGAASYLAWHHRLRLLNDWMAGLSLPVQVRAGGLDWSSGVFRIEDVRLLSRQGVELGRAERLDVSIGVDSARHRRVDALVVEGLQFTAGAGDWQALIDGAAGGAAGAGPGPGWEITKLSVVDAVVDLTPRDGSRLQAVFGWQGGGVAFVPGSGLQVGPQNVTIDRLEARTRDGGAAELTDGVVAWSLDPATRTLDIDTATWSTGALDLTPGLVEFFSPASAIADASRSADSAAAVASERSWTVRVRDAGLGFQRFGWHFPAQTEVSGSGTVEGGEFRWDGDWSSAGHRVRVTALKLVAPGQGERSQIEVASGDVRLSRERGGPVVLEALEIDHPSVRLQPDTWGPAAEVDDSPAAPTPGGPSRPVALLKAGRLSDGNLSMAGVAGVERGGDRPAVRAAVTARAADLTLFSDGRFESAAPQSLAVADTEVAFLDEEPLVQIGKLTVEVIPDLLRSQRILSRVESSGLDLRVDGDVIERFGRSTAAGTSSLTPAARDAAIPWWRGLSVADLALRDGRVTLTDAGPGMPDVSATVAVTTRPADGSYLAVVSDVTASAPDQPDPPVARVSRVALSAHPSRLWERRLDGLAISGLDLVVGPGLHSLALPEPKSPDAPPDPPAAPPAVLEPGWHLDKCSLENGRVEVSNLVPRLDPVTFQLAFALDDVPLTLEGLRAQRASHRIELSNLRLNSAYGSTGSISVAEFDHLFVEFSLGGLLDQRLDRVEVIGPTIYVGEQLFWYVDYFRKYAASGAPPGTGVEGSRVALASTDRATIHRAVVTGSDPAARVPTRKGWSVARIDAYYGRFVLALKGSILDTLPALPFSCSTQLDQGRVDLTLDIPRDTYRPSSQLPLELDVLEGTASFNLPLKEQDNNLVQVFKASELRYKDFKAHDVFLSVTYDRYGVYARFGGKLYGGYLSGGGDLYLDDNTSWDGWLVGEAIDLAPLTAVLTPNYLSLTGISGFEVLSYGDLESLYTATGTFSTSTPGEMTIHALSPLKDDLPVAWSKMQRSLTERGVETLRDFPFNECRGDFKLFHQEGDLTLRMTGPLGTRTFDISLHDHRGPGPASIP